MEWLENQRELVFKNPNYLLKRSTRAPEYGSFVSFLVGPDAILQINGDGRGGSLIRNQALSTTFVDNIIIYFSESEEKNRPYAFNRMNISELDKIEDRNNVEAIIPNSVLMSGQILNYSKSGSRVRLGVRVPVPLGTNFGDVVKIASTEAQEVERVLKDPALEPKVFLAEHNYWATIADVRFWIRTPEKGIGNVKSDVLIAVSDALRKHGIESPKPVVGIEA